MAKRKLKDWESKQLKDGNTYTFAFLIEEFYPEICKENGFGPRQREACRNCFIDFSEGIYVFYANNGDKHFFDTDMAYRGFERY